MTTTNPATELAQLLRGASPSTVTDWPAALALADRQALLPAVWSAAVAHRWSTPLRNEVLAAIGVHSAPGTQPPLCSCNGPTRPTPDGRSTCRPKQCAYCGTSSATQSQPCRSRERMPCLKVGAHPAARVMRDLDILVPRQAAEAARAALLADGYLDRSGQHRRAGHEYAVLHRPGHAGTVELQVAPLIERWPILDADALLAQAPRTSTTDAVIHTIAHAQLQDDAHLLRRTPLRSLHEIATVSAGAWAVRSIGVESASHSLASTPNPPWTDSWPSSPTTSRPRFPRRAADAGR